MPHNRETNATREVVPEDMASEHLWLHVVGDESFETFPLPPSGLVVIGRSTSCDIQIDAPAVSRRHCRLHLGESLQIEDLGSANGTSVRERVLAPNQLVPLLLNDLVVLGGRITVTIKTRPANERRRRLWGHGYFEGRLEDECAQSQRFDRSFALLHLIVERAHSNQDVRALLSAVLRSSAIIGLYCPGAYEILLVDIAPAAAQDIARSVIGFLKENSVTARIGVACYPNDGTNPDTLIAHARAQAQEVDDRTLRASLIVRTDPKMRDIHELIGRIASADISVLLLGETGTGKEVVAATVHRQSQRVENPFIRINCAALNENLLESELFGYEKGAFTGANRAKLGLLEAANHGTIFLDEVGEMPMATQVKLLRVLEEREVLRVGGLQPRAIDVRFVSATNRNLEDEIEKGRFRQDLYFRLNGITIEIPPLRERKSEIEPLARGFISYYCQKIVSLSRARYF